MRKQLTRTYKGKEVLCQFCKTKDFKSMGNMKQYGVIVIHKKNCAYIKKLKGDNSEVKRIDGDAQSIAEYGVNFILDKEELKRK